MDKEYIIEYRTTWNNDFFIKNKSKYIKAKNLIKKSHIIVQLRLYRQLKYTENNLTKELQVIKLLNNYSQSSSLVEGLQQRLNVLKNEIDNYNYQIKNILKKEKEYWKELEQIIAKRINLHKTTTTNKLPSSQIPSNTTFVTYVDKNNENIPPLKCKSPVKIPKIRKKKKCLS